MTLSVWILGTVLAAQRQDLMRLYHGRTGVTERQDYDDEFGFLLCRQNGIYFVFPPALSPLR